MKHTGDAALLDDTAGHVADVPQLDPAQATLDAIDAGVVVFDELGRVTVLNEAAAVLLGCTPDQLLGRTSMDPRSRAMRSDGSPLAGTDFPAMVTLRTGEPVTEFEMGVRRPDGSLVWVLVSSRLRRTDPREVVATFVDISMERSAERALLTTHTAEQVILRARDEDGLLQDICDALLRVGGHRLVWIGLANDDDRRSVTTLAATGAIEYLYDGIVSWSPGGPRGRGPVGTALRDQQVVVIDDVETDHRFAHWAGRAASFGFGSVVTIPFLTTGQRAALAIYAGDAGAFDERHLAVLSSLGKNLEHALANLHRREQLDTAFESTVAALANLSELRDPYTAGHQDRVAELSVAIGERLGLDPEVLWLLRLGGLVHDIGKTTVPSEILTRPGKLDPVELALVQRHTTVGERVLRAAELPSPIPEIAVQHHERLDGSGYPHGLRADAICLPARIVAVADVVEAMAHHRPYRPGLGLDAAIAEVVAGSGTLFDPDVVAATCQLFDEGYTWSSSGPAIPS